MAYRVKTYTLREEATESGTRYFISFKDGQGGYHELEVSEQLFIDFRQMERKIQPANITKYDYINIPAKDTWGVVMRKDSPLAKKEAISKEDLLDVPLICSRQAISQERSRNEFTDWFGEDFEKLDIVTTFNLV